MDDEERERSLKHMSEWLPPFDFSIFPDFDIQYDDNIYDSIPNFHGNGDSAIEHIINFIKAVTDFNVVHEYNLMYVFVCFLDDDAYDWFLEDIPIKSISSLSDLFKAFLIKWQTKVL